MMLGVLTAICVLVIALMVVVIWNEWRVWRAGKVVPPPPLLVRESEEPVVFDWDWPAA